MVMALAIGVHLWSQHVAPKTGTHHDVEPPQVHQCEIAAVVHVNGEIEVVRPDAEAEHGGLPRQVEAAALARRQQQP